ncbi:MAG: ABC transporter permease subunit, partial [Candidatus Eremiobacteraeota bacterium]|nr:ABC transporter permease subunit [Candidatus Eremiobacteraeota bacterium]
MASLAETVAFLREPVLETIAIAAGALPIALVFGSAAALAIARGGALGWSVRAIAALVRAVPELVLAIVFVVALGFGPVPGTLALGISGAATVAKLYAELLESVRREPEEALRATGATAATGFLVALLPAAWPGIVGFGAYTFESIVRAAVVVGVVGAGGLGSALITSIALLDYAALAAYLAALVVLVFLVDAASNYLREQTPAWVALAAFTAVTLAGVAAFASAGPAAWKPFGSAFPRVVAYLARAVPPDFAPPILARAGAGVLETRSLIH